MIERLQGLEFKHKLMLLLATVLALAKFVLVPVSKWQDEFVDEIKIKQNKLNKIQDAIENQEQYAQNISMYTQRLTEAGTTAFEIQDMTGFQIAQQNVVESMLQDSGLKVTRVGWADASGIGLEGAALLDIRFTGMTKAALDFLAKIESIKPGPTVYQYNYQIRGHRNDELGLVTGFVRLSYPYREDNV